jgi:hypothetical protein
MHDGSPKLELVESVLLVEPDLLQLVDRAKDLGFVLGAL